MESSLNRAEIHRLEKGETRDVIEVDRDTYWDALNHRMTWLLALVELAPAGKAVHIQTLWALADLADLRVEGRPNRRRVTAATSPRARLCARRQAARRRREAKQTYARGE